MQPRVAHVRDVAISGDSVSLRGYSAWFVRKALEGAKGGFEGLVARSGVPPERRVDLLRARSTKHVGCRATWMPKPSASGSNGSSRASCSRRASQHRR